MEDIILKYELLLPIVDSFPGDTDKFDSICYKLCSEVKDLKDLDHNCSMILHFETVNQTLAHLAGATIRDDVLSFDAVSSKCL